MKTQLRYCIKQVINGEFAGYISHGANFTSFSKSTAYRYKKQLDKQNANAVFDTYEFIIETL